ncbi:MAG TPA: glycolate oxidase subunit GlcE [Steroidobacteraceae bacterium]|nr:glycolate oxidase subunit GlcE [Steroidobacteraceae bacterium]
MITTASSQEAMTALRAAVCEATATRMPLRIRGGGTKDFYGNATTGSVLDPRRYSGVVAYEPSELVVTARAGTPLAEVEHTLAEQGQMLAFEPPHFGEAATLGGCIASGLAGPRRTAYGPCYGGVRDFVLGARMLDGRGEILTFGGRVMKNVAGYDVARLLVGSLGILGVILEVSVKVLPQPAMQLTLSFELEQQESLDRLNAWAGQPLPLSASMWHEGMLSVRLSGSRAAVMDARTRLGGEMMEPSRTDAFWTQVREQAHPFFAGAQALWRVCVPATLPALELRGEQLIEWGGALRWLRTSHTAQEVRAAAQQGGGHATLFRGEPTAEAFTPLPAPLMAVHRRLKCHFDPAGIFNPGRLYREL